MAVHVDVLWTAAHHAEGSVADSLTGRLVVMDSDKYVSGGGLPATIGCFNILTPLKNGDHEGERLPYVPPGSYDLALDVPSPKFSSSRYHRWAGPKDPYVPRVLAVPKHSGILIHPGNVKDDSQGCILVGTSLIYSATGQPILRDSVTAYLRLVRLLREGSKKGGCLRINFSYDTCW